MGGSGGEEDACNAPVFTHLMSLTLILVDFAATQTRRHLCTRPAKGSCAARSRLLSFTWWAIHNRTIPPLDNGSDAGSRACVAEPQSERARKQTAC